MWKADWKQIWRITHRVVAHTGWYRVYWPPALHGPRQMKITDIICWRLTPAGAPVQFSSALSVNFHRLKTHTHHIHRHITFLRFISFPPWLTEVTGVNGWRFAGYLIHPAKMWQQSSHTFQRQCWCVRCAASLHLWCECVYQCHCVFEHVCVFSHTGGASLVFPPSVKGLTNEEI